MGNIDSIDLIYYEVSGGKILPKELKQKIMSPIPPEIDKDEDQEEIGTIEKL